MAPKPKNLVRKRDFSPVSQWLIDGLKTNPKKNWFFLNWNIYAWKTRNSQIKQCPLLSRVSKYLSQKGTQPIYVLSYLACWHGGVASWRGVACLRLLERGEHTTKDCITKDLSTFVDYLAHLSRNNCLRSNLFHEVVTPSSSLESRNINALGSSWKCKFQSCFLWLGLLW